MRTRRRRWWVARGRVAFVIPATPQPARSRATSGTDDGNPRSITPQLTTTKNVSTLVPRLAVQGGAIRSGISNPCIVPDRTMYASAAWEAVSTTAELEGERLLAPEGGAVGLAHPLGDAVAVFGRAKTLRAASN